MSRFVLEAKCKNDLEFSREKSFSSRNEVDEYLKSLPKKFTTVRITQQKDSGVWEKGEWYYRENDGCWYCNF